MKSNLFITRLFLVLSVLMSILFINSCQKDAADPPKKTYSIEGLWEGTMIDAIHQPLFLSIKTNGTCTMENISPGTQENLSYGSWTLKDTTLTCILFCPYGYVTNIGLDMTYTGTYDKYAGTINGIFHLESPEGNKDDGVFALTKTE